MIKTKTVETVEEFDENGKLVRKTTTEKEETDDNPTKYIHTSTPHYPFGPYCVTSDFEKPFPNLDIRYDEK